MKFGVQDKGVTCGHARRRSAREFLQVARRPAAPARPSADLYLQGGGDRLRMAREATRKVTKKRKAKQKSNSVALARKGGRTHDAGIGFG